MINIGDTVEILSWEEILAMGRLDPDGDIYLRLPDIHRNQVLDYWFMSRYRPLCGQTAVVTEITKTPISCVTELRLSGFTDPNIESLYVQEQMVVCPEVVRPVNPIQFDCGGFVSMIGGDTVDA